MAGLVGLNDVRAKVQAAVVGTRNKTWKDSMWSDFMKDVVSFLVDEKSEDPELKGRYNFDNVKEWSKKVPGEDIFNLKYIFFPINL